MQNLRTLSLWQLMGKLFLPLLVSMPCLAAGVCGGALSSPKGTPAYLEPVSLTPNIEEELKFAGDYAADLKEYFQTHTGGSYAYLIVERKGHEGLVTRELILSFRFPYSENDGFGGVVSHRSLYNKVVKDFGEDFLGVVAAGELMVLNGQNRRRNNKSSTFLGKEESNRISAEIFSQMGWPDVDGTDVLDYSEKNVADRDHTETRMEMELVRSLRETPVEKRFLEKYIKIYRDLSGKFPSAAIPGGVEPFDFYNFANESLDEDLLNDPETNHIITQFVNLLVNSNQGGVEYGLKLFFSDPFINEDNFKSKALRVLRELKFL